MITQKVTVESWSAYFNLAESLSKQGWAFRGQANSDWNITSTIDRYLKTYVNPESWSTQELRSIKVFKKKAHSFLKDPSSLNDTFRCLALMQHHGAPTRLIDFSKSPYIAAFFALERTTTDAAVFALNIPRLWDDCAPKGLNDLTRQAIDPRNDNNLEDYFLSNKYPVVWPGEPRAMDKRIIAQSGTFVVSGILGKTVEELLEYYPDTEVLLYKIILPKSLRMDGIEGLYRMNITNGTLFPGLDGLARSIATELEINWTGDKRTVYKLPIF